MRANDKHFIMHEINRFCGYVQALRRLGKITEEQMNRQIDAAVEVEACIPVSAYERIEWTDEARQNFDKIVKFNKNR